MRKPFYARAWLNPTPSHSNSYVAVNCDNHEAEFELADCNHRVSIHTYSMDKRDRKKFVRKMLTLRNYIDVLIERVESFDE